MTHIEQRGLQVARYNRLEEALALPICFACVAGYVAWRLLTCAVDGWADWRAGRVPIWARTRVTPEDEPWEGIR